MIHSKLVRITRRFHFSASHRYWIDDWTDEQNKDKFGKNTLPHGHNYVLEVTLEGPIDPITGMILNLSDVKKIVGGLLDQYYDHKHLNADHPAFLNQLPTTEKIALQLAQEITEHVPDPAKLFRIKLWETENLYAEVICA